MAKAREIPDATTDTARSVGDPSSLYHFYMTGDNAYQSDGTLIAAKAAWPFLATAATLVKNTSEGPVSALGIGLGAGHGREAPVELRVGLRGINLPQEHLAMRPGQIEDPVRETPILIPPAGAAPAATSSSS